MAEAESDYLFNKPTYQISVFVDSPKNATAVIEELKSQDLDTLYIKDTIYSYYGEFVIFNTIFQTVVFSFVIGALFAISYFLIRLIFRSRQAYYAVVRILGGSKGAVKHLINIELFTVCTLVFGLVCAFAYVVKSELYDIPQLKLVKDTIEFLQIYDYGILYVIVLTMVWLIARKIAKDLFVKSAAQIYREGAQV